MAKLVGPLGSFEARGKVDDLVYNTWRGISYVRARVSPANQFTAPRVAARAATAALTALWQSLTDSARLSWSLWATSQSPADWTGNSKRWTGYNAFVWCNWPLQMAFGQHISAPPPVPADWHPVPFGTEDWGGQINVDWALDGQPSEGDLFCDFRLAGPGSLGAVPDFRQAVHVAYPSILDANILIPDLAAGRYGLWLRVFSMAYGQPSCWQKGECIVA